MARIGARLVEALHLGKVDLLGFSVPAEDLAAAALLDAVHLRNGASALGRARWWG